MKNRRTFLKAAVAAAAASAVTVPTVAQAMGKSVASGTFVGKSNHVTTGGVSVVEEGGRYFVELADDFSLDSGPDPRVGFGNDGVYDKDAYLGALLNLSGKQRYAIPSTWNHKNFNEVYIWCEVASVPLGVASIK